MLTKKDYIRMSAILSLLNKYEGITGLHTGLAKELSSMLIPLLKRDNDRFDKSKFLKACQFGD